MIFMRRLFLFLTAIFLLSFGLPAGAQESYIRASRLGITFISSLDHLGDETRYQKALLLGAGWTRWPMYWDLVEMGVGQYNWGAYDQLVSADLRHGLQINAILLGSPGFHRDGGAIQGLSAPAFSDGTDTMGEGKTPNPANPWALFVYQAVTRYKPGGLLAQQNGWPPDQGITVWEAWNEPDFAFCWSSSPAEYARLLKVTYLIVHQVDPNARVMFGGLAYSSPDSNDWLGKVLDVIANDPERGANNWFLDMVAVHNYTYARRSYLVVRRAKQNLERYGLDRPIWLNESGVPVWDDYPGPTWTADEPASRILRATEEQAASFVVESTVYAWAAGADVVFYHQLYDDCGNQPAGTDFPPNDGDICTDGACWGDAHGLYRNERGSPCFSQSPLPGTPRPAAGAYYRLAQVFGAQPFDNPHVEDPDGSGVRITFERPATDEQITVVWNRTLRETDLAVPAAGVEGQLYSISDQDWFVTPIDGLYSIGLPPATRDDYPYLPPDEVTGIGGPPFILIEKITVQPSNPALPPQPGDLQIGITPGAITATLPPRPTVDPAFDTSPPVTIMSPLPIVSPATFTVYWSAQDDGGIDHYLVWVRVDGGDWQPWLETPDTHAEYTGEPGKTYEFAAWAVDLAGNWSLNTELTPQTSTAVQ
jgi:hypothetical protein